MSPEYIIHEIFALTYKTSINSIFKTIILTNKFNSVVFDMNSACLNPK